MRTRYFFLLPLFGSLAFMGCQAGPPAAAAPPARPGSPALTTAPRYTLRPGRLVVGWFPYSLPASTYGQYNYSLLSHLVYTGSRATDEGLLELPASQPAALVKTVHQANKRCQVLLSVSYRQPAAGPVLFDSARQDARRQLVSAIVAQVKAAGADGVNLDFAFRAAVARPSAMITPARSGAVKAPARRAASRTAARPAGSLPAAAAPAGTKQQQAATLQKLASDLATEQESVQDDKALLATVQAARKTREFTLAPGPNDPAGTPKQRKAALGTGWASYRQQVAAYHRNLGTALKAHDQVRTDSLELLKGPQKMTLKNLLAKLDGDIKEAFARYQADILSRRQAYYAQLAAVRAKAPALAQVRESLRKDSLLLVFDTQGTKAFSKFAAGVTRRKQALEKKEITYKARQQAFQRAFPTPPATLSSFVQLLVSALRQGNPAATVALSVPAHDSARTYADLREVAALVQLVVLKPAGSSADSPTAWQSTLTTARHYYQRSGIRHDSLIATFLPPIAVADSAERAAQYHWAGQRVGGVALPAPDYGVAAGSVARALVSAGLVQAPPKPAPLPWLRLSPRQQVLLSVVAVLLGAVLLGFVVAAVGQLPQIVPFPARLGRAILLTGLLFALVSTYLVALRHPYNYTSVLYWLVGLGVMLAGVFIGCPRRPRYLP
ncbi:hypothetical protein [Hymenobacter bucti]|uniref:GH18 domain-containing protein n=1 Tax=Hymenobacter bucti TaxID=1844114 RepID=A0ABW4QSY1_9BACT